jgi:hypothetical protein
MKEKIIRLKECFRVSKIEDHYQQFDSLCIPFFLLLLFNSPFFFFSLLF